MSAKKVKRCAVIDCHKNSRDNPDTQFFFAPRTTSIRGLWMAVCQQEYATSTNFCVCEDHFDMEKDVEHNETIVPTGTTKKAILKKFISPHLKIGCSTGGSNPVTSDQKAAIKTFVNKSCQTNLLTDVVITSESSCQTDDIVQHEKRNTIDSSSSLDYTESSFETLQSSGSIYNPEDDEGSDSGSSEYETDDDEEMSKDEFSEEFEEGDSFLDDEEKRLMCEMTLKVMENNLRHYTGIPKDSTYIIQLIVEELGITSKRNVFLVLRKIRHNESFQILGDLFGISRQQAGKIFCTDIEKLSCHFRHFIYLPEPADIRRKLPLQFKHKYKDVQIIIDCFETSIAKPSNPVDQSLTWSQYKHSNTIKYLIGATPDGFICFLSKGYTGRISDTEIVRRSGLLGLIQNGTAIMADRGFKDIVTDVSDRGGVLYKPPSTIAGVRFTAEEAKYCKSVAATRIHIERVISGIRDFMFLKPHNSLLHSKRTYLMEHAVVIASAICNIQGLLTKI